MNAADDQSGSLKRYRMATAFMWLALPANALLYATSWKQLPPRLATHFTFENQQNGWMSREESVVFAVFFATCLAVVATIIVSRVRKPDAVAWGLLGLFYLVQGTLLWAENATIAYNVQGVPVNATPVLAVGIAAAVLLIGLALLTRRGPELHAADLLAEETHSSSTFAALMVLPTVIFAVIIAEAPLSGVKIVLGLALVLMLGAGAMAWTGFHYVFTPEGVEVRTLGFRLRSIPAYEIHDYEVADWSFARGYGIRGVGEKRAYVWGNSGVRIKLNDGEVFLGHEQPGRIIHALDVITNHKGHEET